jgi:hypothetical protein
MPMLWRMKPSREVRWARWARLMLASFAVALVAILHVGTAEAGTLQLQDTASLFTSADRSQIQAAVARYPFDARVLTTSAYPDQQAFSRFIGGQVNEANEVVIGIDPVHHHTQVHFGTGSHVASGQWTSIERAGNGSFHGGQWAAGVIDILDLASSAVTTSGTSATPASSGGHAFAFGGLVFLFFIIAVPILFIMMVVGLIRRMTRGSFSGPSYGSPGYGGGGPGYGGGGPGYGGPGYGGGYQQGGMGPVGGGLIGAGLGGVAGYELGKAAGERENNKGGGGGFFDSGSSGGGSGGSSFDAGGGGSSWDSGGGGGDSGGGGGSDFGGGGGGDFGGGGGGDSGGGGGGGSDW